VEAGLLDRVVGGEADVLEGAFAGKHLEGQAELLVS